MPCMLPAGAAKCPESKLKTNINVVGTGNTRQDKEKIISRNSNVCTGELQFCLKSAGFMSFFSWFCVV